MGFFFDETKVPPSPALTANVRAGILTPEALFMELADCFKFPDYFGTNWNAVEECIRDLSWLPPGPVLLRHADLPLVGDIASQKIYLSILSGATEKNWTVPGQIVPDLFVIFPSAVREQVEWLQRSAAHDENGRR